MPLSLVNSIVTVTAPAGADLAAASGVMRADQYAFCDQSDYTKQIAFDASLAAASSTNTIKAQASSSGVHLLPNTAGSTLGVQGVPGLLQYSAPIAGATVTALAGVACLVLEPAGTLATLTVVLPAAPADGFRINVSSTQIVTALTLSAGGADTIVNAINVFAANGFASYVYKASSAKWYRIG